MAALRAQVTDSAAGGGDNLTAQLTGVQAGDLLTVCFYERDGTAITSIADDVNGAWDLAVTRAATAARSGIYYFRNSGAGNPTLTVTLSGTSPRDMNFAAWSGMDTVAVDTTNNAGNSATTSHSHGAVTPSASALILTTMGIGGAHGGISLHSGFTALDIDAGGTSQRQVYAYKLAHTGAITVTHTSTSSVSSDAVVAAFLEAAGGGGGGGLAWIKA